MRGKLMLIAMARVSYIASLGFGFTAGPQIEERFGSEYGSEYYHRLRHRTMSRCGDKRPKRSAY
jgi:hypothetical protein